MAPFDSTLRDAASLVDAGLIPAADRSAIAVVAARYAIAIPPALQALIGTADDPIGRQFVPTAAELDFADYERADPIGDEALSPVKGIVHRYPDRALLKPLLACPVYCRFCFRREQVGPDGGVLTAVELDAAFTWLAGHPEISEVIVTGGEPLSLSPRRLEALMQRLRALPHVDIARVHTRLPVADPARIDGALVTAMAAFDRGLWLVLHVNHVNELTTAARAAIGRVQAAGIPVLSQSVLLRGVNDNVAALEALFRALLAARVKPYYLHHLDPAPGTAHFRVPIAEGQRLLAALRGRISGLAWPTYVLDIPGGHGKVPIGPTYLRDDGQVIDPAGRRRDVTLPSHLAAAMPPE